MNKHKQNLILVGSVFLLIGLIVGFVIGESFVIYQELRIVEAVKIDNFEISFNQTQAIDYMFEKMNKSVENCKGVLSNDKNQPTGCF